MVKRTLALLIAVLLAFSLVGCISFADTDSDSELSSTADTADNGKSFTAEEINLRFTVPSDWVEDNTDTELDWYCENSSVGMGIFGYFKSDYADGTDFTAFLKQQTQSGLSEYSNAVPVEHEAAFASTDKNITCELYSAEYNGVKLYRYFCYVEFADSDEFYWVTFSSLPSYMKRNFGMLEKIIDSFEIIDGGDEV